MAKSESIDRAETGSAVERAIAIGHGRKMRFSLLFAAALTALVATPVSACTVPHGYRVPTNLELAERADTILIGTVEREEVILAHPSSVSKIVVRPTLLLKGPELPAQIELHGSMGAGRRRATRSNPRELHAVNPDAMAGACVRYLFEPGMKLVLFFERHEGQLHFAFYPFARVSEDIPSDAAPWVRAVRIYVEIAALPPSERRAALMARRDALRAAKGDPDAELLATDIDRVLKALQL